MVFDIRYLGTSTFYHKNSYWARQNSNVRPNDVKNHLNYTILDKFPKKTLTFINYVLVGSPGGEIYL